MRTKLNLGAGNIIEDTKEWINHDLTKHREEIEIEYDLNEPCFYVKIGEKINDINKIELPRTTGSNLDEIKAWDVIEHLNDPVNFVDNCHHLLKEGGVLYLKACGYTNVSYWIDITHKKGYHIASFDYFDPTTELGKEYGFYTKYKWKISEKGYDRNNNVIVKMQKIV